jgi:hypothetical protein
MGDIQGVECSSTKSTTTAMLVDKIKEEVKMWCLAGAKALNNVMPRE